MVLLNYFVLVALPIVLFLVLQKKREARNTCPPPGPRGLPFIGNLHQLDHSLPHLRLLKLSKRYGPLISLRVGQVPIVVISSARLAEEALKTHDTKFCSRPSFLSQQKLSYNGLDLVFGSYNDYWSEMRKICVVHLFSSIRTNSFRPVREAEVARMIEKVTKAAMTSKPFNISEAMMYLSSAIICRVAFNKRFEEEEVWRSRFQSLLDESQVMFTSFFVSDYFPFLGFVDKLRGLISRLDKNFKEFDTFYQEIIEEHLDPKRPKPDQEDLLDVLLQIWKARSFKFDLTFDHIKAILMNVFVAGTETTAASIVWAMTYLMKNQIVLKKVQKELRDNVGQKGHVDEDDIKKMMYLKAVVKETMRLQPLVPLLLPRETMENCNLDGYEIKAKSVVHINTYAIGRDPQVWEKAEEFQPERFIGSSIDLKGQDFELLPFGAGRRICPGMHMGLVNLELALANLLYKFQWEMPTGNPSALGMDLLPGITVHKKIPLSLVPKLYTPSLNDHMPTSKTNVIY